MSSHNAASVLLFPFLFPFLLLLLLHVSHPAIALSTANSALPPSQLSTLRLSIIQDHFQFARKELLLSLILHQAQPTHLWAPCVTAPTTALPAPHNQFSCYTQPPTAAHLFLFFSFDNATTATIPEIPTHHHPTIVSIRTPDETPLTHLPTRNFFFRSNNQRGAFTVPTHCHQTPHSTLFITLSFLGYTIRYTQQCPHPTLPTPPLLITTAHQHSPPWHAGPTDAQTTLALTTKPPLESLHVLSMRIYSDRPAIIPTLDHDQSDFISPHNPWHTTITYNCLVYGPSSATITLTLDLAPYDTLNKTWRKSCGASNPPEGLIVSTAPWRGDIAHNGRVLTPRLPVSRRTTLYIAWLDTLQATDLVYGNVHLTVTGVQSHIYTGATQRIKSGTNTLWILHVRCSRVGSGVVELLVRFRGGYLLSTRFLRTCSLVDVLMEWARWLSGFALFVALATLARAFVRRGRLLRFMQRVCARRAKHL